MKLIDKYLNGLVWKYAKNKHFWENYSFFVWFFTKKCKLRADYVEFTAVRYSKNVLRCLAEGYQPLDFKHTKKEFWLKELPKFL